MFDFSSPSKLPYPGHGLKGRKFESIEEQNTWLARWKECWAAPRIHGRKKRQILEMFAEEKPLQPLPIEGMRYFDQVIRTVDDAGTVQVAVSFYAARRVPVYSEVVVRVYNEERDPGPRLYTAASSPEVKAQRPLRNPEAYRIQNPSRKTVTVLAKARKIGSHSDEFARQFFNRLGRPGQKSHNKSCDAAKHV
jgi:hypothetical protein